MQERLSPQGYQVDRLKKAFGLAREVMAEFAENTSNSLCAKSMGIANTSFDPVGIYAITCKGV